MSSKSKVINDTGKFSLRYFILKSNTLILYREIYKYSSKIQDNSTRSEIRSYIRSQFEDDINKKYESSVVEYKLGLARKRINDMKSQIDMTL